MCILGIKNNFLSFLAPQNILVDHRTYLSTPQEQTKQTAQTERTKQTEHPKMVSCNFWHHRTFFGDHRTYLPTSEEQTEQTEQTKQTEQTEQTEH
jgi:hypothetical protein